MTTNTRARFAAIARVTVAADTTTDPTGLPDGTGGILGRSAAAIYAADRHMAARDGALTWRHVLQERVHDVLAEDDPNRLRDALTALAATTVHWLTALDDR